MRSNCFLCKAGDWSAEIAVTLLLAAPLEKKINMLLKCCHLVQLYIDKH